ncbi:putative methyltransferase AN0656 [Symbiodinium microadriaticum]|uniref:Putative methyltransferase AN0656 n=1 Tax=Symbiodinium microadriaticum TaxID=2951 RepID=A0A1Q9C0G8_SYMMI|nr:putative methyltransferase AN0656 [Symbiodinium microadriaticum]
MSVVLLTLFAQLPEDCRPQHRVTVSVARTLPQAGGGGRLTLERLDILPDGECVCPQLPEGAGTGAEYPVHLSGAVFGVPVRAKELPEDPAAAASLGCESGSARREDSPASTWKRFQELEERDRRFRNKFQSIAEFQQFERTLQWFRAHDCTESHRLTHSCFKGRSDFTQTGMLVFDTEEDLEGLNKAIAWLYDRRIPVVLMERQTRIFPLIFDMDLKVTSQDMLDSVPVRIKRTRPWRGRVDFCRWHGADHFVLSKDMVLLRHLGMIVFQFFPDLPLIDFCIFNASGWDRVKELVKVSLHLVAPYVLVTPDRLTAIRERMLEYLGECSEADGHPLADLLQTYLQESEDNTWDKVVDQTVTSGTNGLRMPYCDKAQRILKREFVDRKRRGEVFTERQLMDLHAYLKEEAGRPCLPEGILRLIPAKNAEDENALPEAKWMCKGDDLPIDEWIRLGRCRYAWRMPLAPPGPTPWRPPLRYQWVEPVPLWEDRTQLKGSPVVRKFHGSAAEFRSNWEEALSRSPKLSGRWLISSIDARWRGGLENDSTHEVRYIVRASRVILLLSPEVGAALVFTELRKVLAGWTEPDDFLCVPICGSPSDSHSSALHTIVAPSKEFPTLQAALNAVPSDEPLHRVLVRCGTHELPETLCIKRPVLLEGEGRWETTLRSFGMIAPAMARSKRSRFCLLLLLLPLLGLTFSTPRPKERSFGQQLLDMALESPLYKMLLVPQARRTMVDTAEANGIGWSSSLEYIRGQGPWDDTVLQELEADSPTKLPSYYKKPFHAYDTGNLNWEAAFEQELASRAVGARNFPAFGKDGEDAFRAAFDNALASLGAAVPDGGVIVDMGCGTGISTRRLAARFPKASRLIGLDLSPYFVAVGRRLMELEPEAGNWVTDVVADKRVELRVADVESTGLPDECATTVNLCLVIHELPPDITRRVCVEALRLLKPGGQLWITEMDFSAPGYVQLRSNPLLFALIRSTEPYLDEYADSTEELFRHLAELEPVESVRLTAATGRHFAVVVTKGRGKESRLDDRRWDEFGNYVVEDTHLQTWESKLSETKNQTTLRLYGPGAHRAMVRNLRVEVYGGEQGGAAVEIDALEGEAAVVGCYLAAEGTWGTCVWARGGSPQIVRNFVARARWGVVLIGTGGRVEDNSIRGLGEAGLVLVGGSAWVHRNRIADCGGPAVLAAMDCKAVLQENDIRECLSGVRIIGKQSEIQMRPGNRLLHNGLCDEHQVEAPPGVIPSGSTATVRSCRPYPFLPKDTQELLRRMRTCREHAELAILMRSARRRGLLAQAYRANRRLTKLRKGAHKAPPPRASPAKREVLVVAKAWDGPGTGFGQQSISVELGELCEVLRRDASGWILVSTSRQARGWCSPHVFG